MGLAVNKIGYTPTKTFKDTMDICEVEKEILFDKTIEISLASAEALAKGYLINHKGRIGVLAALATRLFGFSQENSFFEFAKETGSFVMQITIQGKDFLKLVSDNLAAKKIIKLETSVKSIKSRIAIKKNSRNEKKLIQLERILILYKKLAVYQKAQKNTTILFHASSATASVAYLLSKAASNSLKINRFGHFCTFVAVAEYVSHYFFKSGKYASQDKDATEL